MLQWLENTWTVPELACWITVFDTAVTLIPDLYTNRLSSGGWLQIALRSEDTSVSKESTTITWTPDNFRLDDIILSWLVTLSDDDVMADWLVTLSDDDVTVDWLVTLSDDVETVADFLRLLCLPPPHITTLPVLVLLVVFVTFVRFAVTDWLPILISETRESWSWARDRAADRFTAPMSVYWRFFTAIDTSSIDALWLNVSTTTWALEPYTMTHTSDWLADWTSDRTICFASSNVS